MSELYTCPCCGEKTLPNEDAYDRCPICWWVDDGYQKDHPDEGGCANVESLNERKEWCEENRAKLKVRALEFYRKMRNSKMGLDF